MAHIKPSTNVTANKVQKDLASSRVPLGLDLCSQLFLAALERTGIRTYLQGKMGKNSHLAK